MPGTPLAEGASSATFKAKGEEVLLEDVFKKGSDSRRYDLVILLLFGKTGQEWLITQCCCKVRGEKVGVGLACAV